MFKETIFFTNLTELYENGHIFMRGTFREYLVCLKLVVVIATNLSALKIEPCSHVP
jgi:hypothetical protein